MHAPQSILVVEDDRNLAETLVYNLKTEGYEAGIARTGLEAIALTRTQQPDLVLLDIMLPEMDGFDVCRVVRATSPVPIIMITARDDEVDRVLGLELGADDYVVKPFSLRELFARIRATLRRVELSSGPNGRERAIEADGLVIDPVARSVQRDRRTIHLLPREYDLLLHLMRNRGIVLSRNQILEKVWGPDYLGDTRTVDVHVRRLRMKIERDDSDPRYIKTIYGVGYTFNARQKPVGPDAVYSAMKCGSTEARGSGRTGGNGDGQEVAQDRCGEGGTSQAGGCAGEASIGAGAPLANHHQG